MDSFKNFNLDRFNVDDLAMFLEQMNEQKVKKGTEGEGSHFAVDSAQESVNVNDFNVGPGVMHGDVSQYALTPINKQSIFVIELLKREVPNHEQWDKQALVYFEYFNYLLSINNLVLKREITTEGNGTRCRYRFVTTVGNFNVNNYLGIRFSSILRSNKKICFFDFIKQLVTVDLNEFIMCLNYGYTKFSSLKPRTDIIPRMNERLMKAGLSFNCIYSSQNNLFTCVLSVLQGGERIHVEKGRGVSKQTAKADAMNILDLNFENLNRTRRNLLCEFADKTNLVNVEFQMFANVMNTAYDCANRSYETVKKIEPFHMMTGLGGQLPYVGPVFSGIGVANAAQKVNSLLKDAHEKLNGMFNTLTNVVNGLMNKTTTLVNSLAMIREFALSCLNVFLCQPGYRLISFALNFSNFLLKFAPQAVVDKVMQLFKSEEKDEWFDAGEVIEVQELAAEVNFQIDDINDYTILRCSAGVICCLLGIIYNSSIPDITLIEKCITRFGNIGRAVQGISQLWSAIEKQFNAIVDWIAEYFGIHKSDPLEEFFSGITKWFDEIKSLTTRLNGEKQSDLMHKDPMIAIQIENLYKQGMDFTREIAEKRLKPEILLPFHAHFNHVKELYKQVDTSGVFGNTPRPETAVIMLHGGTGVGKSGATWPLAVDLNKDLVGMTESSNFAREIYFRRVDQEFWDGYTGQNIVVYDDFGQMRDTAAKPNPEFYEVIRCANIAPYPLHMAELSEKKRTKFVSKAMILSSNILNQDIKSLTFPGAFFRRMDLCYHVRIKPEFATKITVDGKEVEKLDFMAVKAKFGKDLSTKVYLFDREDPTSQTIVEKDLSYEQMLTQCRVVMAIKIAKSKSMIKELIDYSKETLPTLGVAEFAQTKKLLLVHKEVEMPEQSTEANLDEIGSELGKILERPEIKNKLLAEYRKICSEPDIEGATYTTERDTCPLPDYHQALGSVRDPLKGRRVFFKDLSTEELEDVVRRMQEHGELLTDQNKKLIRRQCNVDFQIKIDDIPGLTINQKEILRTMPLDFNKDLPEFLLEFNEYVARNPVSEIEKYVDRINQYLELYDDDHLVLFKGKKDMLEMPVKAVRDSGNVKALAINIYDYCGPMDEISYFSLDYLILCKNRFVKATKTFIEECIKYASEHPFVIVCGVLTTLFGFWTLMQLLSLNTLNNALNEKYQADATIKRKVPVVERRTRKFDRTKLDVPSEEKYQADATIKRKVPVVESDGDHSMEMWKDETAQTLISARIFNSLYRIAYTHDEDGEYIAPLLNGMFICGRAMLLNKHVEIATPRKYVYMENCNRVKYIIPYNEIKQIQIYDKNGNEKDAVLWLFPKQVPTHADIRKHFVTSYEMSHFSEISVCLPTMRYQAKLDLFLPTILGNTDVRSLDAPMALYDTNKGYKCYLREGYEYCMNTMSGDCGSPLIINDTKFLRKIIGIHSAGSVEKCYATAISQSDLERALETVDLKFQVAIDLDEICLKPHDKKPCDGFNVIGKGQRIFGSTKTDLGPSLIHGMVKECTTKPAHVNTEDDNLVINNLKKAVKFTPTIPDEMIKRVYQQMRPLYIVKSNKITARVLTPMEAVEGVGESEYIGPLNRSTSPGYPWVFERKANKPGKTQWLGENQDYKLDQKVLDAINLRIENAKKNKRTPTVWVDTLKDERRPIEKVDAGKTRVFAAGEMSFTLCFRMYFLTFIANIMENRIDNEQCIGINPCSREWGKLARKIQKFKGNHGECPVIAGDFSNFDGSLNSKQMWAFCDMVNEWYRTFDENWKQEDDLIREILFEEIVSSVHIYKDNIYWWTHSQPSGQPATTVLNSWINSTCFRMCFYILQEEFPDLKQKLTENQHRFDDVITMASYGDDDVANINPDYLCWINQQSITDAMEIIGYTYTDETKSGEDRPCRNISEIKFLKRSFYKDCGIWKAPLDLDTTIEMTSWTRGEVDKRISTLENVETSIRELYQHPREIYDEWRWKLEQACVKALNKLPSALTFEEYWENEMPNYV